MIARLLYAAPCGSCGTTIPAGSPAPWCREIGTWTCRRCVGDFRVLGVELHRELASLARRRRQAEIALGSLRIVALNA